MTYIEDLAPCRYFGEILGARLLAVGWLEPGFDYPRGDPGQEVYEKLKRLLREAWQPFTFHGFHVCGLCTHDGYRSSGNLFVPSRGVTYASPGGIIHYIEAHEYCPPREYCDAVIACPGIGSPEYFESLRACGWPQEIGEPKRIERLPEKALSEISILKRIRRRILRRQKR
jgi:hypothetical protein